MNPYDDDQDEAPSLAAMLAGLMMARNNSQYAPQLPRTWKPKRSLADLLGEGAQREQRDVLHYPWGAYGFSPDASEVHGLGDQIVRPMPGIIPEFRVPNLYHRQLAPHGVERPGGLSREWLGGPKWFEL